MIEAFQEWVHSQWPELERKGLSIDPREPRPNATAKRSISAVIESPTALAQIVVWESGECATLAFEKDGERPLVNDHHDFRDPSQLGSTLNDFVGRLL